MLQLHAPAAALRAHAPARLCDAASGIACTHIVVRHQLARCAHLRPGAGLHDVSACRALVAAAARTLAERRCHGAGCEWRGFDGESDTGACVVADQDVPDKLDRSKVNTITSATCKNSNQQPNECAEAVSGWLIETGCNADCILEQIQTSKACSQDLDEKECKKTQAPSCSQFSGARAAARPVVVLSTLLLAGAVAVLA